MKKKSKKILIAEDEKSLLKLIVAKLELEGFSTVSAVNGEDCLKAAVKEKPDLILLDIVMPKMDGLTALNKLRANEKTKDIPVIMLTNLSDSEKLMEALRKGAYDYLIKSDWKISDVVKKVKERLSV